MKAAKSPIIYRHNETLRRLIVALLISLCSQVNAKEVYYIVVASYSTETAANEDVEARKLSGFGDANIIADKENSIYRVYVDSSSNKEKAYAEQKKMRDRGYEVWLYNSTVNDSVAKKGSIICEQKSLLPSIDSNVDSVMNNHIIQDGTVVDNTQWGLALVVSFIILLIIGGFITLYLGKRLHLAEQIYSTVRKLKDWAAKNALLLFLFATYILFHTFFERCITIYIVDNFLSYLHSSLVNDIILLLVAGIIITRLFVFTKRNYHLSGKTCLFMVFFLCALCYYRFITNIWIFTPMYLTASLKYADILLLLCFSNILICIRHKQKGYLTEVGKGFCFDNPILDEKHDILNRNGIAATIADKIKNTASVDSAFTLGISSEWGNGKTSFLNLIESHVKENNRIIIHFNPWLNNDENAIVKSFFDELSSKLHTYNKELSKDILVYAKNINKIETNNLSWFTNTFFSFLESNNNLRKQFEVINEAIHLSGLQLVIIIDDLDRLYEKEILEVLRLIRNSANFSNTCFIVAYDRNYLISALQKVNEYHSNYYLEKIFQMEITLPAFDKDILLNKLENALKPYLAEEDKQTLSAILKEPPIPFSGKNSFNVDLLDNLRDVNRFINSFVISYESLKGECVILDLLNVELLRTKFVGVYDLLASNYNSFLMTRADWNKTNYLTLKVEKEGDKEKEKTYIEEYMNTHYKEVGIQENQIRTAMRYLYSIFPNYGDYTFAKIELLSIANPASVGRYFHYRLLDSDLSEIEFSKYRMKPTNEFQAKIAEWVNGNYQNEVLRRLEEIEHYRNREDYEKVIETIFFYASLPADGKLRATRFDGNNLMRKLEYRDEIKLFYPTEDEFKVFVKKLFDNQQPPYLYISEFMNHLIKNGGLTDGDWRFIISKEDLKRYKIDYFSRYAGSINEIDYPFFWLYHYCEYKEWVSTGGNSYRGVEQHQNEADEIFKECAKRIPSSFIKNIISRNLNMSDDETIRYSVLPVVKKIWKEWSNFEAFLDELSDTTEGLQEFKVFYSTCKKEDFSYMEFEFKEIDLTHAVLANT